MHLRSGSGKVIDTEGEHSTERTLLRPPEFVLEFVLLTTSLRVRESFEFDFESGLFGNRDGLFVRVTYQLDVTDFDLIGSVS